MDDWAKKDLERYAKEQRMLDDAEPHEYIGYVIGVNAKALKAELRTIKYLLLVIAFLMAAIAHHTLPEGWYWNPWW